MPKTLSTAAKFALMALSALLIVAVINSQPQPPAAAGPASTTVSASVQTSSASSTKGAHAPWPEIKFERAEYGMLQAGLPEMHRLTLDLVEASSPHSAAHKPLLERFQVLVTHNLVPEVASQLDTLLRQHAIIYTMSPAPSEVIAGFDVRDGYPYLDLNASTMAAINSPNEVAGYMLAIAHEYTHYLQWKKATSLRDRATFSNNLSRTFDAASCQLIWQNERDAYYPQCQRANANGLSWRPQDPRGDMCPRIRSEAAFSQALYYTLAHSADGKLREDCDETWWDISGGPRVQ